MTIYDVPTISYADWAKRYSSPGQTFAKDRRARWFFATITQIVQGNTVNMHLAIISITNHRRKHYPA